MERFVLFTYLIMAVFAAASIVLAAVAYRHVDELLKKRILSVSMVVIGMLLVNTVYFLSYFDSLVTQSEEYDLLTRGMDVFCSMIANVFWFRYLTYLMEEQEGEKKRLRSFGSFAVTAVFAVGLYGYLLLMKEDYLPAGSAVPLTVIQLLMTAAIVGVTGVFSVMAWHHLQRGRILWITLLQSGINMALGLYNGIVSIRIFHGLFRYEDWSGTADFNNILFVMQSAALLVLLYFFYKEADAGQQAEAPAAGAPWIDPAYGLTPREEEIACRILERRTYEEIAEELFISKYTVKRHVHNIYEKTGVSGRKELQEKLQGAAPKGRHTTAAK